MRHDWSPASDRAGHGAAPHVLVMGAGLAGLVAGLRALEVGARVTICEKATRAGGTTLLSTGFVWTFGDYDTMRESIPDGDPALQWLVCESLDAGHAFLAAHGVDLGEEVNMLGHGRGRAMAPPQAIDALVAAFRDAGGELRLDSALENLITENGRVTGARVLQDGALVAQAADAVVLATGGFQGNPELLTRYVVPEAANLALRANPYSTGDGLLAATAAGAAVSQGLSAFYGHALAAPPARYTPEYLGEVSLFHGRVSVALNLEGRRFVDETAGTGEEWLNQALARQPRGEGFFLLDATGMDLEVLPGLGVTARSVVGRAEGHGATVYREPTIDTLAERLADHGVPADRVREEIARFNAAVSGYGETVWPPRRHHRHPLVTGPFVAVHAKASITFSMGGLCIDERGRVLRRSGSTSGRAWVPDERAFIDPDGSRIVIGEHYRQTPVPGLFAAGCDVGNVSHVGYAGGLATALATGLVAGESAAAMIGRDIRN